MKTLEHGEENRPKPPFTTHPPKSWYPMTILNVPPSQRQRCSSICDQRSPAKEIPSRCSAWNSHRTTTLLIFHCCCFCCLTMLLLWFCHHQTTTRWFCAVGGWNDWNVFGMASPFQCCQGWSKWRWSKRSHFDLIWANLNHFDCSLIDSSKSHLSPIHFPKRDSASKFKLEAIYLLKRTLSAGNGKRPLGFHVKSEDQGTWACFVRAEWTTNLLSSSMPRWVVCIDSVRG